MALDIAKHTLDGTPEAVIARYASLPERAATSDFGAFDRNIVVIDTETTGVSVRKDELTQIAAARLECGEIVDWYVTFVNQGMPIPEDVAHLTDIHDADVADAPDPQTALAGLVEFVGDAKLVAHNAGFDRSFTTKHPAGYPLLENTWLDSLELARIALPRMRSHRLIDLVRAFDAPLSTHRADEDVAATCALYRLLLAGVQAMPAPLVREISQLAPPTEWPTGTVFAHFANEELRAAARKEGPAEGDERSTAERPAFEPFSLKEERRAVAKTAGKPKRDAATMISAELADRAGISVREMAHAGNVTFAGDVPRETSACAMPQAEVVIGSGRGCGPEATEEAAAESVADVPHASMDPAEGIEARNAAASELACGHGGDAEHAPATGTPSSDTPSETNARAAVIPASASLAQNDNPHAANLSAEGTFAVLEFPTPADIDAAFSAAGLIGDAYPDYQQRDEQLAMAQAVRTAFATSDNLVVEAGTGVGKSMAYLVPAALTALRNDINVGVATKSNALLDQLIYHELPTLADVLERRFGRRLTYAPLKGFTHYPCLRKVQRIARDGARMVTVQNEEHTQAPAIAALLSFIQQTEYDDIDSLKIDYRLLPRRAITTTSHDCMRRKCPFYGAPCFVHGQRRRAETADIVVTNHSLFFCDVAADGGLLPPIRYWVVDEAHGAEAEARRALSLEIAVDALNSLASRVSDGESARSMFARAERTVVGPAADTGDPANAASNEADFGTLFYALTAKAKAAGTAFAQAEADFATHVRDLLYFDTQKRSSYEYTDLWINAEMRRSGVFQALTGLARTLIETAEKLVAACQELVGYLEDAQGAAAIQREIAATAYELKDLIAAADTIFVNPSDAYVYAATLARKPDRGGNVLTAQLYNVGAKLDETLYVNTHAVVYASATLTVAGSFDPFLNAMGLNTSSQSHASTLALGSPFDFDQNMTIYVPNDLPDPTSPSYIPQLVELLKQLHVAQGGSMLTLFTNRKEMDACYQDVQPHLKTADLRLVCQRWGVSVKGLRDDFLADETLSLFALKSFWEGFDAPGSTLRGVVLPKLPFSKPTDPLSCERNARDDAAWRTWVLPQAVLEVKQAVGRLLRKADDQGIVVLADARLLSKSYGKVFMRSMPSNDIRVLPCAQIVAEIEARSR